MVRQEFSSSRSPFQWLWWFSRSSGRFWGFSPPLCWPTRSYCSLQSFMSVASGLQSAAVELFFHFVVTYSARLIFHFCVADLIATQNVPTQPVPLSGRRKYFQNVRAFIFWKGTFHSLRGVKGMLNMFFNFFLKKNKKNIILYPNFKLIKYKFFHCLLT